MVDELQKMREKANRLISMLKQQREAALDQVVDLTAALEELRQELLDLRSKAAPSVEPVVENVSPAE